MEGRKYSHDSVDVTGINVMLNTKDVSEYLKISPNGLEVNILLHYIVSLLTEVILSIDCNDYYYFRRDVMHTPLKVYDVHFK